MILIDTSAWIEYDRATESDTDTRVTSLIESGAAVASTDPVLMELLAGARNNSDAARLRRLLVSSRWVSAATSDFESAAAIYRACRRAGLGVRNTTDCLIAVIALRSGSSVLAAGKDFERIASVVPLQLDSYN